MSAQFSIYQLRIVRFCAIECELQMSGERSVAGMVGAWCYAQTMHSKPSEHDVLVVGRYVEPVKNLDGYRQVPVRIGHDVKADWISIPRQMANLVEATDRLDPAEWFYEFEKIHPFLDGNGRTGQVLFNWLNGSLAEPVWAPNFFDDPRRVEGAGIGAVT